MDLDTPSCLSVEPDVDIDLGEVYFLILHFLSTGPCKKTFGQFRNELLEHQLLPRRYHAWYSRSGAHNADKDDDGKSVSLCYADLVKRYSHIDKDHLVKLLKQLIVSCSPQLHGIAGGTSPNAADVPTILGSGSFSLLASVRDMEEKKVNPLPSYLRWPHMQADQVRGLSLREIGGGFTKHHRAPSVRAACYAIAKPSTLVQKMQVIKKMRGHQNAVYCAIFDRSGRYVITGSDDRLVKIWSMETAFCLASCRGHEGDITDLAVSSNNALVASSSNDFSIRVWRIPDGLPISVLRGHIGAVTAIAFSPRSVYQLLSSSDDGTCRIWDARHSQQSPRIYIPKPPDSLAGKSFDPSSSVGQQSHQILCCSYNANGTVFVTGSSDTYARVWNAGKFNPEDSEQPNHEMDLLSGHENDVNYVQFSGCAVVSRSFTADTLKEDNIPKFKNSWFTHDNIVTCSRDGSAIIWIPRSRRSHGKVGRWTRAYHLKVPPPPMAPQPPRGGPRQRHQQTPRGVNMIVWSLDNRFVLAAIMDCRICVWNASDGSLVHSLIGHSESTFVLDVHPFNPRIAMSAGYDGKTIIWDIWEGTPVRIYETGRFKLVDGKFSPDGTSIILSDEVGQIFIIATGQGESQKDAKYDQFFLGDYRPLIQDTNGNVVDQETQLAPHRRNIQDLLCDSSMIPYPDPYQNMYQQRRLGTLGIEWRPSSVKFAVGPTYSTNAGDYVMPPIVVDLESWEPLPTFLDAIDWEPENEIQSDDNDSEYNVTDEYPSEAEVGNLSTSSSGEPEFGAGGNGVEHNNRDGLRRSKRRRRKKKSAVALLTSGRRVKRRNWDGSDGDKISRKHRKKSTLRKKSTRSKALRPQRRSARNALNIVSEITGSSSNEYVDLESSSESDSEIPYSSTQSIESERSMQHSELKLEIEEKNMFENENEDVSKPSQPNELQEIPTQRRRLILKLPRREPKAVVSSEITRPESHDRESLSKGTCDEPEQRVENFVPFEPTPPSDTVDAMLFESAKIRKRREAIQQEEFNNSEGYGGSSIRWREVKAHSIKRLKLEETDGNLRFDDEVGTSSPLKSQFSGDNPDVNGVKRGNGATSNENPTKIIINSTMSSKSPPIDQKDQCATLATCNVRTITASQNVVHSQEPVKNTLKFRIRSNGSTKLKADALEDLASEHNATSALPYEDEGTSCQNLQQNGWNDDASGRSDTWPNKSNYSKKPQFHFKNRTDTMIEGVRKTRAMGTKTETGKSLMVSASSVKDSYDSHRSSRNGREHHMYDESKPTTKTIGLRSTRNRRENYNGNLRPLESSKHQQTGRKLSWLMLIEHEESYRYIPQLGDEVVYLRQGHEEYIKSSRCAHEGPFKIKGLKAVEFCKVQHLDYSTLPGSGESCCKLCLQFIDPSSSGFGRTFKLTLAELVTYPDFLVEKTRYDAAVERNWTQRDKCQVWWRNEDGTSGSWWEGRVLEVKPKSAEFPNSPWERYVIKYRSDPSGEHSHSPWELHDAEILWEHPHIDEDIRDKLLSCIAKLERASSNKDKYGIHKLNQVAQKSDFLNRFPLPMSLDVIRRRLENNYYRTLDAVNHDASVMLSNAESYFGKTVEMETKLWRLSEWVDSTFSSL